MKSTDVLKEEHGGINLMLRILYEIVCTIKGGGDPDFFVLDKSVEFLKVFADRCHHGKEEELLFPALAGNSDGEKIIEGLLVDHERGRSYVAAMESSLVKWKDGEEGAKEEWIALMEGYLKLLREHIRREDEELWPLADTLLSANRQSALVEEFEKAEVEKIGKGTHEKFHELMHNLRDRYLTPGKTDVETIREYTDKKFNPKTLSDGAHGKFIVAFFRPGHFIPLHSPSVDLVLYIIEGSGKVAAGNERYDVKKGDIVTVPGYIQRGVLAETDMTVIHVVTPPPTHEDHKEVRKGFMRGTWE